jgi:hypothetical protein
MFPQFKGKRNSIGKMDSKNCRRIHKIGNFLNEKMKLLFPLVSAWLAVLMRFPELFLH